MTVKIVQQLSPKCLGDFRVREAVPEVGYNAVTQPLWRGLFVPGDLSGGDDRLHCKEPPGESRFGSGTSLPVPIVCLPIF